MALTSIVGTTVFKHTWGKFRFNAAEAISQGALISPDATGDGWYEADQGDSKGAVAIAMEAVASGGTGWACLGAEVAPVVDESTDVCAASGDIGSALYLGEEGDVSLSAGGTFAQQVGWVTSTTSFVLVPQVSLSGTALSLSGNCSVGGTLGVTGAATLASTLAVTGNVAVNTNKFAVTAASGNTTVAGTLGVTGDVAVNTNKFTVAAASGNTVVAGTLGVTGKVSADDVDLASGAVLAGVGTGANGIKLKNLKNAAASGLSGTQLDIEIDIGGSPYYFTVYPTKA